MGNLKKIKFRGFPVGKIAEFDYILETKSLYSSNISQSNKDLYFQYIKNSALAIAITDAICKKYHPSLFLTFNEYAQCQAVKYSALKNRSRYMALTHPVHFNIDMSRFSLWESTYQYWSSEHCQNWYKWKNKPISSNAVKACWDDVIFRLYNSGSHIFSSRKNNDPENIYRELKLDLLKKTIVVYTSSQDERRTGEISMKIWNKTNKFIDVFKDQIEWLKFLQKYTKERSDVQIIVRVHPREGNKRSGLESSHLKKLRKIFNKKNSKFIIIWPDDPMSSYDLLELADICLIPWSLMGQEAARLGIPVLSYVRNMFYPDDDFIQVAKTKKEYLTKLDSIIHMEYTWKHLVKAIRFYHWRTFIPALDLSKYIPSNSSDDTIWPKLPLEKIKIINKILSGKIDLITYNTEKWQISLSTNSALRESQTIKLGIKYFIENVFYPTPIQKKLNILELIIRKIWRIITGKNLYIIKSKPFLNYNLKIIEDIKQIEAWIDRTNVDTKLSVLIVDNHSAMFIRNGKLIKRTSPMIVKLAKLYKNND